MILASAKVKVEDRLEGLKQGAYAYLTKPFNPNELFLCLQNFLKLQKRIQERYGMLGVDEQIDVGEPDGIFQTQDTFVHKAIQIVKSNLEEEGFGTTQLARELGMSRSQLHRKITALTGKPSSQFINAIRLNRAKQLLRDSDLNVSEIAYEVGLEPNYFTRIFKEYVGMAPTTFRSDSGANPGS